MTRIPRLAAALGIAASAAVAPQAAAQAPGASGYLGEQLKCPLVGARIGQV